MNNLKKLKWWKGAHGEWYVVIQVALAALVFLGPRTCVGWPDLLLPFADLCKLVGGSLMAAGGILLIGGMAWLGKRLTPLPFPKPETTLVETGPYAFVRHPVYSGGILLSFGWAIMVRGWLTLVYAAVLLVFLDIKSRREERWLVERFPSYQHYQRRVRKLIPFVY